MSSHISQVRAFQVLCVLLAASPIALGDTDKYKTPILPPCKYTADFSNTENSLRTFILKGATEAAAKVLTSNETFSLGAGLMYEDEQTCFLTQSSDRTRDPDVVALQALAIAAERGAHTHLLARSTVLSFTRNCECLFTPQELDEMLGAFQQMYEDPEERRFIIEFDGTEEEEPEPRYEPEPKDEAPGRRLLVTESSPTNSFVCAHCSPSRSCSGKAHWC